MKRLRKTARMALSLLLALGLCAGWAGADTVTDKSYIVTQGSILPEPNAAAFWEYPTLSAGQSREGGVLRLANEAGTAMDIRLKSVELPYGNDEALAYLDALRLRITDGDDVVYDGDYSRVMDGDGLNIQVAGLAAGEEKRLNVALYCDFRYEGDPQQTAVQVNWLFEAVSAEEAPGVDSPGTSGWLLVLLCVAGGLVILCVVVGALNLTRRSAGRKK